MSSVDKLTYFNFGGKGQPIRLAYVYGGIEFEDERIEFSGWPERKPTTPLGQLPVLTVDGKQYVQTVALLRYVGGRAGIYPACGTKEQLIVDDVVSTIEEAWATPPLAERRAFVEGKMTKLLHHVESFVTENSGDAANFILGNDISIADIFLYSFVHILSSGFVTDISADDFKDFAVIQRILENVKSHPKLADHIAAGNV
jgi:prostaglandin-H2 D-isomerase / glutathione transferase